MTSIRKENSGQQGEFTNSTCIGGEWSSDSDLGRHRFYFLGNHQD
jgi:hypothetical protein